MQYSAVYLMKRTKLASLTQTVNSVYLSFPLNNTKCAIRKICHQTSKYRPTALCRQPANKPDTSYASPPPHPCHTPDTVTLFVNALLVQQLTAEEQCSHKATWDKAACMQRH